MGLFGLGAGKLDVEKVRKDFNVLGSGVIYFDSACMSLKPKQVVEKVLEYYNEYPGCAGRSQHKIGKKLEEEIAKARSEVRKFINAGKDDEIIFTRNTTESINLVANTFGLEKGDEVIVSDKEHNSNLIPWLKLQKERGVKVVVCKRDGEHAEFNLENFKKCFSDKTKLVSIVHVSNLDGSVNPIEDIIKIAHDNKVKVLVDAAQSVPHKEINVKKMDCDFLTFSGHKMLGPTSTGVLYGKKELLEKLSQFIVGGHTVIDASYINYLPEKLPEKFEAGLQHYAGIVGLGEACRYLKKIGMKNIHEHELQLNKIVTEGLKDEIKSEKVKVLGPAEPEKRSGIFSFNVDKIDPHHVARVLDSARNIAVRSGAHCVHSWFEESCKDKSTGSVRASFYLYNTEEEAKTFVEEVKKIVKLGV